MASANDGLLFQLPKRSAPDLTATEDEYRDWSDEDATFDCVDSAKQVCIFILGGCIVRTHGRRSWSIRAGSSLS